MFLKDVYRHSRWMFAGMLFFAGAQLIINLKKGMVFSPFYHYGMYSEVALPKHVYPVTIITINGDTLRGKDFTPVQWDKFHYLLQQVIASKCDSLFFSHQVKRLYHKAGLNTPDPHLFINEGTVAQRLEAFTILLAKYYKVRPDQIHISQNNYAYTFNGFVFRDSIEGLTATNQLCP